jgi:uncharacterized damage-inducible protein DinB
LIGACTALFAQLERAMQAITPEDFRKPSAALGGSTVGQHLRHTLEFFLCLELGMTKGRVNYDQRAHDKHIETDRALAIDVLCAVSRFVESADADKTLVLDVCYHPDVDHYHSITTSYSRELAYNIEHVVHHMAIMKIALREVAGYVVLPADFGVAESTLRHRKAVAASDRAICAS